MPQEQPSRGKPRKGQENLEEPQDEGVGPEKRLPGARPSQNLVKGESQDRTQGQEEPLGKTQWKRPPI